MVACGYSQIQGIDFQERYSSVINDVTWRILLIMMLKEDYDAKIVDVKTEFFHEDLEKEIYMECPKIVGTAKPGPIIEEIHLLTISHFMKLSYIFNN